MAEGIDGNRNPVKWILGSNPNTLRNYLNEGIIRNWYRSGLENRSSAEAGV